MDVERVKFSHYGECLRLANDSVEVMVTTDLGPRVICYRFIGETNMMAELGPENVVESEFGKWHPWGGHRLWHAPEEKPRSYMPDDSPVKTEQDGGSSFRFIPAFEAATGIQKELTVFLDARGTRVTLTHKLTNKGLWPVELAPWALTIVRGGGTTIIPQEPYGPHSENLLPARPFVLWPYTNMGDPRWSFGEKYIQLCTDANISAPQKAGVLNKRGWAGYLWKNTLFVKRFPYIEGANYPDFGCNFETFTSAEFMEVESVGPLTTLSPGASVTHVENWYLFANVDAGDTEESLDAALTPLVAKTAAV